MKMSESKTVSMSVILDFKRMYKCRDKNPVCIFWLSKMNLCKKKVMCFLTKVLGFKQNIKVFLQIDLYLRELNNVNKSFLNIWR